MILTQNIRVIISDTSYGMHKAETYSCHGSASYFSLVIPVWPIEGYNGRLRLKLLVSPELRSEAWSTGMWPQQSVK